MTHHRLTRAVGVVCALALIACSDSLGPSGPKISVSLAVQHPLGVQPTLRVDIGGRLVQLTATEAGNNASIDVRGPRYGDVPVHVALVTPSGDSLAAVAFSQQFQRDQNHWVAAEVGARRPLGICIGNVVAASVSGGGADTLFVMYGSIPEGAVC